MDPFVILRPFRPYVPYTDTQNRFQGPLIEWIIGHSNQGYRTGIYFVSQLEVPITLLTSY